MKQIWLHGPGVNSWLKTQSHDLSGQISKIQKEISREREKRKWGVCVVSEVCVGGKGT